MRDRVKKNRLRLVRFDEDVGAEAGEGSDGGEGEVARVDASVAEVERVEEGVLLMLLLERFVRGRTFHNENAPAAGSQKTVSETAGKQSHGRAEIDLHIGMNCIVIGMNLAALGMNCIALGMNCIALGMNRIALGLNCVAVRQLVNHHIYAHGSGKERHL